MDILINDQARERHDELAKEWAYKRKCEFTFQVGYCIPGDCEKYLFTEILVENTGVLGGMGAMVIIVWKNDYSTAFQWHCFGGIMHDLIDMNHDWRKPITLEISRKIAACTQICETLAHSDHSLHLLGLEDDTPAQTVIRDAWFTRCMNDQCIMNHIEKYPDAIKITGCHVFWCYEGGTLILGRSSRHAGAFRCRVYLKSHPTASLLFTICEETPFSDMETLHTVYARELGPFVNTN